MSRHFYFFPNVCDAAFAIDQESCPFDAHIFTAIHTLFDPHAVCFESSSIFIRSEIDSQFMLLRNFACFSALSGESPMTRAPILSNSGFS